MATVEPTVYPATIAGQIERLQKAKADLKTAIEGKGVTVPSNTLLNDYAQKVNLIEQGGGGSSDDYEYLSFNDMVSGATHSAPLMEKNLLIRQYNSSMRMDINITYENSSTGKKFTYTIPAENTYYFLCPKNSSSVTVLTKKTTISIT